ncbi:MAG: RNA-binding protein [Oscillospiraceae bacterium]|nr:RNA-binding protein [Oscillospiraceae bacterium]
MESDELIRRAEDLAARCERSGRMTATAFLTPAERAALERWFRRRADVKPVFFGGHPDCERTMAFFLPDWLEPEDADFSEALCAIRLQAHFGEPNHRDYLGALIGMGVERSRLGDIWVEGDTATVFCTSALRAHLLRIERVGRVAVTASELPPDKLRAPERRVETLRFTVMSPRLDAVTAGMFRLSRSEAARRIALGAVSLNYAETDKPDAPVREGDVISLRGAGKGSVRSFGGSSRKGRLFVEAELCQ